jgi:hypothetical protein
VLSLLFAFAVSGSPPVVVATDASGGVDLVATDALADALQRMQPPAGLGVSNNREFITLAVDSGAKCAAGDHGCWARLASLSGQPDVWLMTTPSSNAPAQLMLGSARTEVLRSDAEGFVHAAKRVLGSEAALVLSSEPVDATFALDDVAVGPGVLEGVAVGVHRLAVRKEGLGSETLTIDLGGGEVKTIHTKLGSASPALLWVGGALVSVGVLASPLWVLQLGHCGNEKELPMCRPSTRIIQDRNQAIALAIVTAAFNTVGVAGGLLVWYELGRE